MKGKFETKKKCAKWPVVLLVILAILAALAIWQRENIQAVWIYLTTDSDQVAQDVEAQRQEHQAAIEEEFTITVKPPDRAQSDALLDGTMTPEEVKEHLGIPPKPAPDREEDAPAPEEGAAAEPQPEASESQPETPQPAEPARTREQIVNDCVAELYAYKTDLMAQLGVLKQETLAAWAALEPSQRTASKKMSMAMEGLGKCYELEAVADEVVEDILDRYRAELEAIGSDTAIMDTLWEQYCEEKVTEKAYYLDKYL